MLCDETTKWNRNADSEVTAVMRFTSVREFAITKIFAIQQDTFYAIRVWRTRDKMRTEHMDATSTLQHASISYQME